MFARQISQLWQTHKSPLQHSAALLREDGSLWIYTEAKRSLGVGFQVVQVKLPEREGEKDFANHVCCSPAALVGGWVCRAPSSPDKVCESPQFAAMPQLFHLHRGTPAHRQLPSPQDHREGELCQGEAGTTRSDWARGETLFYN